MLFNCVVIVFVGVVVAGIVIVVVVVVVVVVLAALGSSCFAVKGVLVSTQVCQGPLAVALRLVFWHIGVH